MNIDVCSESLSVHIHFMQLDIYFSLDLVCHAFAWSIRTLVDFCSWQPFFDMGGQRDTLQYPWGYHNCPYLDSITWGYDIHGSTRDNAIPNR